MCWNKVAVEKRRQCVEKGGDMSKLGGGSWKNICGGWKRVVLASVSKRGGSGWKEVVVCDHVSKSVVECQKRVVVECRKAGDVLKLGGASGASDEKTAGGGSWKVRKKKIWRGKNSLPMGQETLSVSLGPFSFELWWLCDEKWHVEVGVTLKKNSWHIFEKW